MKGIFKIQEDIRLTRFIHKLHCSYLSACAEASWESQNTTNYYSPRLFFIINIYELFSSLPQFFSPSFFYRTARFSSTRARKHKKYVQSSSPRQATYPSQPACLDPWHRRGLSSWEKLGKSNRVELGSASQRNGSRATLFLFFETVTSVSFTSKFGFAFFLKLKPGKVTFYWLCTTAFIFPSF